MFMKRPSPGIRIAHGIAIGVLSGIAGMLGSGILEAARIFRVRSDDAAADILSASAHLLSHGVVFGSALGAGLTAITSLHSMLLKARPLQRWKGTPAAAIIALPFLPLCVAFSRRLLSGPGISQHALIEPLRVAAPAALVLLLAAFLAVASASVRAAGRPGAAGWISATAACAVWIALAFGFDWISRTQYRTAAYDYIHEIVALATWIACAGAAACLLVRVRRMGAAVPAAAAVLVAISGTAVFLLEPAGHIRLILDQGTVRSHRLVDLRERLISSRRPALPAPEDMREAILAGRARAAALAESYRSAAQGGRPRNVLWVTIDTMRADRLSCYGHSVPTSPVMDALAAEGILFERAWAQNPLTSFSFQSMFYSRYPRATPLYREMRMLPDDPSGSRTLAELLVEAGYLTGCVPAIPAVALDHPHYRVMKTGFDLVNPGRDGDLDLAAPAQNRSARAFLETAGGHPFFLWVHYMEPHFPYEFHERFGFGTGRRERYDGEIRAADEALGELFGVLRERDLWDSTMIIVNSDHGEALGDHGSDFHGSTLYEEQIHVPLIIRLPSGARGRVAFPVENMDLMPTILDLLGVEHRVPLQGRSLAPFLLGTVAGEAGGSGFSLPIAMAELPAVVNELSPSRSDMTAILYRDWKAILDLRTRRLQLHNLATDPAELKDAAQDHPAVVARILGIHEALEEESKTVNVPAATEPVATSLDRIRAEQTPHGRATVLWDALLRDSDSVAGLLRYLWKQGSAGGPEAAAVARESYRLPPRERDSILAAALSMRPSFGPAIGALDSIERLPPRKRRDLVSGMAGPLRELLAGPPLVARRAARVLAMSGERDVREILLPGLESPDPARRLRDALALARLGEEGAREFVLERLAELRFHPDLFAEAMDAVAGAPPSRLLPHVLRILREPYGSHAIKRACLDWLTEQSSEEAIPGFLFLLSGWDPALSERARDAFARAYGPERLASAVDAAADLADGLELAHQGLHARAVGPLFRAAEFTRSGTLLDLIAASAAIESGDVLKGRLACRRVIDSSGAAPWHRAALALLDEAAAPVRLTVVRVELPSAPLSPGSDLFAEAVIRNDGEHHAPGGVGSYGLEARLALIGSDGSEVVTTATPRLFPDRGLPPGEEIVLALHAAVPAVRDPLDVRVFLQRRAGAVHVSPAAGTGTMLHPWGEDGSTVDPEDADFTGMDILRNWLRHPCLHGELEDDGSVSMAATDVSCWLIGPLLSDGGRPLRLKVVVAGQGAGDVHGALFFNFQPDTRFSELHSLHGSFSSGVLREFVFDLPVEAGTGVRRVRLDPSALPDVVSIRRIAIN